MECLVDTQDNQIKAFHIQYPTIFWLYQKINNQQMTSPLKKKKSFTLLKKWDEVEFPFLKMFLELLKNLHLQNSR